MELKEPLVLDGLVPEELANFLEDLMASPQFSWHFNQDINWGQYADEKTKFEADRYRKLDGPKVVHSFQFVHPVGPQDPALGIIKPVLSRFTDHVGLQIRDVLRLKANLLTQNPFVPEDSYHSPHVDSPFPHYTLIYYVNDSDGDTIFFKERAALPVDRGVPPILTEPTIALRVTPKKGRAVLFDGSQFHASSHPISSRYRMVINFNFNTVEMSPLPFSEGG